MNINSDITNDIKKYRIEEKISQTLHSNNKNNLHIKNSLHKFQYDSLDFSKNLEYTSSLGDSVLPNSIIGLNISLNDLAPVKIAVNLVNENENLFKHNDIEQTKIMKTSKHSQKQLSRDVITINQQLSMTIHKQNDLKSIKLYKL